MALNKSLIAVIGRVNPAFYDFIYPHGPVGGYRRFASRVDDELNPQPLPPVARFATFASELNPQPLPPGVEVGAYVGHELVRTAGLARALGVSLRVDPEEICPPPRWPFPWPFPWPGPWRRRWNEEQWDEFTLGYALGLGAVLEATSSVWERLDDAPLLEGVHGVATEIVEKQIG